MVKTIKKIFPVVFILALFAAVNAASPKPREAPGDEGVPVAQPKPKKSKSKAGAAPVDGDSLSMPDASQTAAGSKSGQPVSHSKVAVSGSKADKPPPASAASGVSGVYKAMAAEDSISEALYRDEDGQDFNSLFDNLDGDRFMAVDTSFAWSNSRINSGRFDYRSLAPEDTIRVQLVDSAQGKFFIPPAHHHITSPFGSRRFLWHYGTDVKLYTGDTVRSVMDGIVRVTQFDKRGYGNVVVVRHHSGLETVYGHLAKGGVRIQANQRVKAGEMIGLGGNTGRSTGAHLHFEIRYFGEPFDPSYIIDFETHTLKSDTLVLTRDNFEYLTEVRKTVYHTIRPGDNLGAIARRYGTTITKLCQLNGISVRTPLRIGRKLVVRSGKEAEKQVVKTSSAGGTVITLIDDDEEPDTGGAVTDDADDTESE
jgi:murein DD-endopeptidase MepM/ murein hydrolase activator NlpD